MRAQNRFLISTLALFTLIAARAQSPPANVATTSGPPPNGIRLIVPDGQLRSHPFQAFVTHPITEAMQPRLRLLPAHSWLKILSGEDASLIPRYVAPNQSKEHIVDGAKVVLTGTTLIFDVSQYPVFRLKPMTRFEPILVWNEPAGQATNIVTAIGKTVYLSSILPAAVITLLSVVVITGSLCWLSRKASGASIYLIAGPDGALSLSRTQGAAWTLAVGGMVLLYGLIRLEIPSIPATLVVLMGMAALTDGLSRFQGQKKNPDPAPVAVAVAIPADAPAPAPAPGTPAATPAPATAPVTPVLVITTKRAVPKLTDLVSTPDDNGVPQVSLARAQLVFWTCLTLGLFVTKTILEGELWDVPSELVALMGVSQASYLTPKFLPGQSA